MVYSLRVSDRQYKEFHATSDIGTEVPLGHDFDPVGCKIFHEDRFIFDKNGVKIVQSKIRDCKWIPGVLLLEGNKVYGKHKRKNLYRCIPDDKHLPIFLIPYVLKLHFIKHLSNKYILFRYQHWIEEHPRGATVEILGNVTALPSFYTYQLYCKGLHFPMRTLQKQAGQALQQKSEERLVKEIKESYSITDRKGWNIISIDPPNSRDFDDAFGLTGVGNGRMMLSIYIANVPLWLESLGLWDSLTERVATIYLPDRTYPMLPKTLSDSLCCLKSGVERIAFTLDIVLDASFRIISTQFSNTSIVVKRNLRYGTREQESNRIYQQVRSIVVKLNGQMEYLEEIKGSHEVVAYLMIMMNYISAQRLKIYKTGIYRVVALHKNTAPSIPKGVDRTVRKFLEGWNSTGGSYVRYESAKGHDILGLDAYVHITSPIRRLVDLLNMVAMQDTLGLLTKNAKSTPFWKRWIGAPAFAILNKRMRSVRKIQNDCSLLHRCFQESAHQHYKGVIFDKVSQDNGSFQYLVFLPDLGTVSRLRSKEDIPLYGSYKFKIHIFVDEDKLKQKVRLALLK